LKHPIVFINADIYIPDRVITRGSVVVHQGKIQQILSNEEALVIKEPYEAIDVQGGLLVPGFIDIHVHGGGGYDCMTGTTEAVIGMSQYHASFGTTSIVPTTLTASQDQLEQVVKAIAASCHTEEQAVGADILGIHLEGPFLNPIRCGAQNSNQMRLPAREELEAYINHSNQHIRLITIAPEMQGAEEVIRYAVSRGITVSIGHTDASYEQVKQAVEWGATHVTHLFNGMRPLHHREPGTAGTALLLDDLMVEVICDGVHVHSELLPLIYKQKSKDRVVFITDSIAAAGLPCGDYELAGLPVRTEEKQVRLINEDGSLGNLAGSSLTMLESLRNGLAFSNLSLLELLPSLTMNPAKQIGVQNHKGSIEIGKDADLLLLDDQLELKAAYVRGSKVFDSHND
jgi:N-acetylglucosamine-6-phosphate deacetylase